MDESSPNKSEVILYQTQDGKTRLEVRLEGMTVWLSLNQMAELFQRDKSVIAKHVKNVFAEGELRPEATVAKFATVQTEGSREVSREIEFYNLDVIISVGYRVKSHRGTQFRIWATQRLREYIVKGFALDDERLKRAGAGNYFEELLARIRDSIHRDHEPTLIRRSRREEALTFDATTMSLLTSAPTRFMNRENYRPRVGNAEAPDGRKVFMANDTTAPRSLETLQIRKIVRNGSLSPGERISPNRNFVLLSSEPRKETPFLDLDLDLNHDRFRNFLRPRFMERAGVRADVPTQQTQNTSALP